jgi:hypothetical protein
MQSIVNMGEYSIIRPMLNISKSQLIDYMTSNSFEWSEDSSNAVAKYKRNKVRLDLVPVMAEVAGGDDALKRRFQNLAAQSLQINSLLESLAYLYFDNYSNLKDYKANRCKSIYLSLPEFLNVEAIIQSKIIQLLCSVIESSVSTDFVTRVLSFASDRMEDGLSHRALDINNDWHIIRYSRPVLEFARKSQRRQPHELMVLSADGLSIIVPAEMQLEINSEPLRLPKNDTKPLFSTSRRPVTLYNLPSDAGCLIVR